MKEELNNTAIKVFSKKHGAKVIQWWRDQGVYTKLFHGRDVGYCYGLFNGDFTAHSYGWCLQHDIKIIELPEEPETKTTQDNKLVAFLKKEGVYDEFVENFDQKFNGNNFNIIEYLDSYGEDQDAVNCAFNWDETDNPDFWDELEDKWHLFLSLKPEKPFPREMWVWDDIIDDIEKQTVIAKIEHEYGYLVHDITDAFIGYKNACELDEIEELSVEQAEQKLRELTGKIVKIK